MTDIAVTAKARPRVPAAGVVVAGVVLAALLVAVLVPDSLATGPDEVDPLIALRPPDGTHWLGTDQLGRDVYARIVHGARISLVTGVAATVLAVVAGTLLGLLSALGGRLVDEVLMRAVDVLLALPGILLALLVIAVLGPGPVSELVAIAFAAVPGYARMIRGQALSVRRADYVTSAVAVGVRPIGLVWRHVLPNSLGPVLVLATLGTGSAIIIGSSLSFLGLGPRQPTPEWGAMLADGRDFLSTAWWVGVFPGLAITVTVVAVTVLGRRWQRRFEGLR
ncbi:ABC transporter permease [Dactylosporangium sp. NPDC006015]|uniref:ABC transporter permease n=1 Tax=Dactylosporangium sp. NPDC006015 TaxID=3154576 RepID=UPI0033B08404